VRILPVAGAIGAGAALGPVLVSRFGTRAVVMTGLTSLGASFAWISASAAHMSYGVIIVQMVLMGAGLGLTQVPATDSILSVLPAAKAGVGSAINDATREAGGTLGVAIVGSVFASLFGSHLGHSAFAGLPGLAQATTSAGSAYAVAHGDPALVAAVQHAFMSAFDAGCVVGAAVCWAGALAALFLPGRVHGHPQVSAAKAEIAVAR
jgi:fucose permease